MRKLSAAFFALKEKEYDEVAINLVAFFAQDLDQYLYMVGDLNPVMRDFTIAFYDWVVPEIRRNKIRNLLDTSI